MTEATVNQAETSSKNVVVSLVKDRNFDQGKHLIQILEEEGLQLFNLLSAEETADAYQKAGAATWTLIKKVGLIIFFSLLLVAALVIWILGIGFQLGFYARQKLEGNPPESVVDIVIDFYAFIGRLFVKGYEWAAAFIKKTLGWTFELPASEGKSTPPEG